MSEIVASPLKPTAKNIAAPPFLENLQKGSIDSFSEHQSETIYINIYIYIYIYSLTMNKENMHFL